MISVKSTSWIRMEKKHCMQTSNFCVCWGMAVVRTLVRTLVHDLRCLFKNSSVSDGKIKFENLPQKALLHFQDYTLPVKILTFISRLLSESWKFFDKHILYGISLIFICLKEWQVAVRSILIRILRIIFVSNGTVSLFQKFRNIISYW